MFSAISIHHHNIGMWLDFQKSLWEVFDSVWAYFLASNPAKFRQAEIIKRYISDIKNQKPDILFLTEVCGVFQRNLIADKLLALGYNIHIVEAFELWNMPDTESQYLYNIIGTNKTLKHQKTFNQYRDTRIIRFLQWKNGLRRDWDTPNKRVRAILDWAWSHYTISGMDIWVMHVHWLGQGESDWVLRRIVRNLPSSNEKNLVFWDLNLPTEVSQAVVSENYWPRGLKLLETKRTYPFIASRESWILTEIIRKMWKKTFIPSPRSIFLWPRVIFDTYKSSYSTKTRMNCIRSCSTKSQH